MAAKRTERLMNLVIALLHTRSSLTKEQIRQAVAQYGEADVDAFDRMLERDKSDLRDLGIPLQTVEAADGTGDSYRISRPDYELASIDLAPDEAAAVSLAARTWRTAVLAPAASRALAKLDAAGASTMGSRRGLGEEPRAATLEARIATPDVSFEPLLGAVRDRAAVSFDYRPAGAEHGRRREVEPWGLVCWHGHWYVAGHDRSRDETRVFRLSRVAGQVRRAGGLVRPRGDVALTELVARTARSSAPERRARLRVRAGRAADLRRHAPLVERGADADVLELGYGEPGRLVDRIAAYGADVVVLDPPEARQAMTDHLRELVGSRQGSCQDAR
jgi:predicted DNA-binding transcriptional regulator YafY